MAQWFQTSVRYDKTLENGTIKKVTESYLVDALSFTEAEARTIEERTPYMSGEFDVSAVKKCKIAEIFTDENGDRYYMVKVAFVTIDEKTAIEKKTNSLILVQAVDFKTAYDNFVNGMKGTVADYEIVSIVETSIVEIYPVKLDKSEEKGE